MLDTLPEPQFDALVEAAAVVCGAPISLIALIDSDRQCIKASVGFAGITETSHDVAFCDHTIMDDGLLEVPDATIDSRFLDSPLATQEPGIRFYAGIPLRLGDGSRVGSLCIIDRIAHRLTVEQRVILHHLATAAVQALESRRTTSRLAISQGQFQPLSDLSPLGVFSTDSKGACTYTVGAGASSFGYLRTLSVDFLKIDGQCMQNLIDDPLSSRGLVIRRCGQGDRSNIGIKTVVVVKPQRIATLATLFVIDRAIEILVRHRQIDIRAVRIRRQQLKQLSLHQGRYLVHLESHISASADFFRNAYANYLQGDHD